MRTVINAELDYDKVTPSNDEVKKKLAAVVSADESLVVVKKIANKYGLRKAIVTAYVYNNAEGLKKIEPRPKVKKEKVAKAKKSAAAKPKGA